MIKQRRTRRLPVKLPVQLRFSHDRPAYGIARDLNHHGIFIETDARPGLASPLDLYVPGLAPWTLKPILFPALVAHRTDAGLGLAFQPMDYRCAAALERLLAQSQSRRSQLLSLLARLAG